MSSIRKSYVDIADGQIHVRHRPGIGTPVLFLHQTASSGAMWDKVIERWEGGHPLHAIDTPGFGGSFDPPGAPTMADYAGWAIDSADALGFDHFHIVGHHTGSAIGLEIAAAQPGRVASLALIGPAPLTADERKAFAAKLGHAFPPTRSGAYLLKNWEYLRVGGADRDIALLHREMVDMLRAWASRPHAYAAAWSQDSAPLIRGLTCPAVAIAARDDILFPYLGRLAALRPDIDRIVLEVGANFEPDLAADALTAVLLRHVAKAESERRSGG